MKCPATPSEVSLTKTTNGVYEKYIGKTMNGQPKRWRFGTDEAFAKVAAWHKWQEWEGRPADCVCWEMLALITPIHGGKPGEKATYRLAKSDTPTPAPAPAPATTLAEVGRRYLDGLKRRMERGGIQACTYQSVDARLGRVLELAPKGIVSLSQINQQVMRDWIHNIASRPACKAAHGVKVPRGSRISPQRAKDLLQGLKTLLTWAEGQEDIDFRTPKTLNADSAYPLDSTILNL